MLCHISRQICDGVHCMQSCIRTYHIIRSFQKLQSFISENGYTLTHACNAHMYIHTGTSD